ncbi:MAG: hypothetical protein ACI4VQ_06450 [Clostridia bacterium]
MNKSLKIMLVTLLLVFLVFSSNCFAVNIDMNLASDLADEGTNVSNTNVTSNTSSATSTTSTANANTDVSTDSVTFSNLSSLPESELGLTNILNILLIAVGFVLVLLAIAILIKIKK